MVFISVWRRRKLSQSIDVSIGLDWTKHMKNIYEILLTLENSELKIIYIFYSTHSIKPYFKHAETSQPVATSKIHEKHTRKNDVLSKDADR